jgi:serine/threonine-protein kinase
MSEPHGKDPTRGLESPRTLRLVRSDANEETLPTPPEGAANPIHGEHSPVEQTLPLSAVQSAANRSAVNHPPSGISSQSAPSNIRFRHLRAWREGGLGRVYIALDEELHREVALKEIKPQHAGNKNSQERFLIEGEVTGSLEHPGIVPVYGMGRYSDGRPYYAMRFVAGETLEEAIQRFHGMAGQDRVLHEQQIGNDDETRLVGNQEPETTDTEAPTPRGKGSTPTTDHGPRTTDIAGARAIAFRELLGRFIAVCNAIAYAHSRGVLHRDLKPGNILLAKYGETLVVDWGLAKVAGQKDESASETDVAPLELQSGTGTAPTRLGAVVGTPAYMSPEQAEGRQDLLGSASDIYSLGATFYSVLTGRSPFMDPRLDVVLENVRRGRFPRPRQVKPEAPRALEAICLKAMALRREDRYETASALADDLEHWLADEPVSAYPERSVERAARWIRRHKAAALTTAIGLLLLTVVAIAAAVLVNHQRLIADTARRNADVAFREARDAVDDLFTKVSEDSLLNQPGMQGLRRDLLQKTLDYYQRFLQQRADDPTVKEEFAATLFRAGRIIDELQSPEKALPYLRQARDIQQQLRAAAGHDSKPLQALADTQNALGRSLSRGQQFESALAAFIDGRKLRQQLVDLDPQDFEYQRALANSVMNIGLISGDLGQYNNAADQFNTARQLREKLLAAGDDSIKLRRDLAMGSYNEGKLELKRDQPAAAARHFEDAAARFQRLGEDDPRDLTIEYLLATDYRLLADAHSKDGSPAESIRFDEQARDGFARLVDRNPEVVEYQSTLAGTYLELARRQEKEAPTAAVENCAKAQAIFSELVKRYPQNPQFRRDLAVTVRSRGILELANGQRESGLQNLRSSVEQLEKLLEEFPNHEDFKTELNTSRRALEVTLAPPETQAA